MANEMIALKAKANKLGVSGYRKMSKAELEAAIKSAQGTGSAKGKTAPASTNGASKNGVSATKGKGKTKVASPAKGKGKSTSAPAKSTAKSASTKGKGATGTAKRQTAAKSGTKTTATKVTKTATARSRKELPARVNIDRKAIDWKAPTNVGTSGKRKDVMDALRKFKGNYDKVFELLQPNAKKYYKSKTKHEAERMLRWLINRVAYDFVSKSGQHTSGVRAAYGTSKAAQDKRRREARQGAAKAPAKRGRPAKAASKTAKPKATAKGKPAAGRKAAPAKGRGKTAAKGKGRK